MLQRSLYTIALAGTLLACGAAPSTGGEETASAPTTPKTDQPVEAQKPATAADNGNGLYAVFTTRLGVIKVKLAYEKAPVTVANFVALAQGKQHNTAKPDGTPFFDGLIFHRVIPGFMIQGGDPTGTGMGSPGYRFENEFDPSLRHNRAGVLSMANSGPGPDGKGTNGSQFFITNGPTPHLDDRHSVFGYVTEGQSVVDAIAGVPRNERDKPNEDVSMTVKIEAVGKAAKAFDAKKVLEANKAKFQQR